MSGLALQDRLVARGDPMPIIFLTGHADVGDGGRGHAEGGLLLRGEAVRDAADLCDKVREALKLTEQRWQKRMARDAAAAKLAKLTPAERRVLNFVVAGNPSKVIAETLGLSIRTIEVHRARITRKLGVKAQTDMLRLVQTAEEEGGKPKAEG